MRFFLTLSLSTSLALASVAVASASPPTFDRDWGTTGDRNAQFDYPSFIALDSEGNVYVSDTNNQRIQKFTADGLFLATFGSFGTGGGQFYAPYGIAVGNGAVYVVDVSLHRVEKFSTDGSFMKQFGSQGSDDGQFLSPRGVAVSSTGKVYVTDGNNTRIQRFDENGQFELAFGSRGIGAGKFTTSPLAVAVGKDDVVYVATTGEIHRFGPNGGFLGKQQTNEASYATFAPVSLAVDADGVVYATAYGNGQAGILEYDAGGAFLETWGGAGTDPGQFQNPFGIAVAPSGKIYVTDSARDRVLVFLKSQVPVKETSWGGIKAGHGKE